MNSRFFDTPCVIKRMVKSMGQYNRPTYTLIEVGQCLCSMDRHSSMVIQGSPQPSAVDRYMVYVKPDVDIQFGDYLIINGGKFKASTPMPYRTHKEISVVRDEEQ